MLSLFESALLERHLRRCAACREFDTGLTEQTRLVRGSLLEQPSRPIVIPTSRRRGGRAAVGAVGAVLASAAAALVLALPGADQSHRTSTQGAGSHVLVAFAASPRPDTNVDVPHLRLQPASIADGPVHGAFSVPTGV